MLSIFLSMLTLVFAIASIIAGLFTAYFGSGKSRVVGGILIVIGLLVFGIFMWGAGWLSGMISRPTGALEFTQIADSIIAIVGAIIGA
ncbi:MAG: hypothetical protein ACP5D6_10525, partial [Kosmotogaceae bacterium]